MQTHSMKRRKKIIATIQARMGSKRLPGKALKKIAGKTSIEWIRERLGFSKELDAIVLATADTEENDPLEKHARELRLPCVRGSESDLVGRLYLCAKEHGADAIVRITGDCPMVDPEIVDTLVSAFREGSYDCVTNVFPPSYPDGLDIDVISFKTLETMYNTVIDPVYREWITMNIYRPDTPWNVKNISHARDMSKYRMTLDYEEDFRFMERVWRELYEEGKYFKWTEVVELLKKKPEINAIVESRIDNHVEDGVRSEAFHSIKKNKS